MSDDAAREDACREYQSSLEDLTFNSKPHINMLTILAEENLHFAKDIVAIIEAQIAKAPSTEKLPVLYLVDSIVKNIGREYLTTFTKNIVSTFICVFEKVDENTRKSLFKLRSTWDDIFPLKKLYALDVRVNSLDPAWPIKPLPPNVNSSSIHVNPKFLNKSPEEISAPRANTPQIPATPIVAEPQKNFSQEDVIRQQLLSKQKQLIELQQKKLELELEQTKAQLAITQSAAVSKLPSTACQPHVGKLAHQPPVPREKTWSPIQHQDLKFSTRDPRLNRSAQQLPPPKDHVVKKETLEQGTAVIQSEKRVNVNVEKQPKAEKPKPVKKEMVVAEEKSKSPSPLNKDFQNKTKAIEPDSAKPAEMNKRDPRIRKHLNDKPDIKDDEIKDKRRCLEKKEKEDQNKSSEHRSTAARNKLVNGTLPKHERVEISDKQDLKIGGRSNLRKRSRSRSPLLHSPKRKERRSPKRRTRSISSSPPKIKQRISGAKHSHAEDFPTHSSIREDRNPPRKNTNVHDPRRQKRMQEDRSTESRDPTRLPSESKEVSKRWKSNWEENKQKYLKQSEDHLVHGKAGPQRHKGSWTGGQRNPAPHTPKQHRLSVDANLQIPDVLNSASKRDLLKKANKRLSDGEITQEEFLVVAHQIKQLFQYQEEKQRSDAWDSTNEETRFTGKKKPLLSAPLNTGDMSEAYIKHKAKLRRTQVHHQGSEYWDVNEPRDENYSSDELHYARESDSCKVKIGSRTSDDPFNVRDQNRDEGRRGYGDKDQEKCEDPSLSVRNSEGFSKDASGSRTECRRQRGRPGHDFRKRDEPRDYSSSEERQKFKTEGGREDYRASYNERFLHPKNTEVHLPRLGGHGGNRKFDGPGEELKKSDGTSRHPTGSFDLPTSHAERHIDFEALPGRSPHSVFDGSSNKLESQQLPIHDSQSSSRFDTNYESSEPSERVRAQGTSGLWRCERTGQTPPRVADDLSSQQCPSRFDGFKGPSTQQPLLRLMDGVPNQMGQPRFDGPARQQGSLRFEGPHGHLIQPRFDSPMVGPPNRGRFDGQPIQMRFDGPQVQNTPARYDCPTGQPGPLRFDGPPLGQQGPVRFDGPPGQQGPVRFDGPPGQQGPVRFDVPSGPQGPVRFEGPLGQQVPMRFDGPMRFEGPLGQQGPIMFDCPVGQQGPLRFDGPLGQQGPVRFEGPLGQQVPVRFEGPMGQQGPVRSEPSMGQMGPVRYEGPLGQQGPGRFEGSLGQQVQGRFEGHLGQQIPSRFEGPPGQQMPARFDGPLGQQVPGRFDGNPLHSDLSVFDCPSDQHNSLRFQGITGHQGPVRSQGPRFDGLRPQGEGPGACFEGSNNPSQMANFNMPINRFGENCFAAPQAFQGQQEPLMDFSSGNSFNGPPNSGGTDFPNAFSRSSATFFTPGSQVSNTEIRNEIPAVMPVRALVQQQTGSVLPGQQFITSQSSVALSQPVPEPDFGQVDVNDLFAKLIDTGIIKLPSTDSSANDSAAASQSHPTEEDDDDDEPDEDQNIPDLTGFIMEEMKQRYDSVINRLYTGIQCYSCGMRFTSSQTDVYADHLDWHYRQNRSEKDISKKVTHRRWYYSLTDWIEFEEIADLEERAKSQFFEKVHEEVVQKTQEAAKEKEFPSVKAAPDVVDEICEICQEKFEMYWEEEEEEWHLKNAIRVEEKTYHPSCYEDYKNSSFADFTPSPSKAPLENPLNSLIPQETEEPSMSESIKQEAGKRVGSCKEESSSDEIKLEQIEIKSERESPEACMNAE
ncbi:pre-mRNA cleavage complex 2 protein Pcf11 [Polypterus senegalus]